MLDLWDIEVLDGLKGSGITAVLHWQRMPATGALIFAA
jgi:hypothetical protein